MKALHSGVRVTYGFGYSFERMFAYILDSAFNLSICASVLSTAHLLLSIVDHLRTALAGARWLPSAFSLPL